MSVPVFTRVLVGWDGSHSAATGLRVGCALTAFASGTVTALSVVPTLIATVTATGDTRLYCRPTR